MPWPWRLISSVKTSMKNVWETRVNWMKDETKLIHDFFRGRSRCNVQHHSAHFNFKSLPMSLHINEQQISIFVWRAVAIPSSRAYQDAFGIASLASGLTGMCIEHRACRMRQRCTFLWNKWWYLPHVETHVIFMWTYQFTYLILKSFSNHTRVRTRIQTLADCTPCAHDAWTGRRMGMQRLCAYRLTGKMKT